MCHAFTVYLFEFCLKLLENTGKNLMKKKLLTRVCCVYPVFILIACSCSQNESKSEAPQLISSDAIADDVWQTRAGDSWPRFLGQNVDSFSKETGILKDWSDGKLRVCWVAQVGEGYGIGSISGGNYFHFDRADEVSRLSCRNVSTGEKVWSYEFPTNYRDMYGYDGGPRTSPIIDNGRVFIFGVDGRLHCVDAESGKKIWSVDTAEQFGVIQNFFGVGSSPIVYKDLLITVIGGSPDSDKSVAPGALDMVSPNGTGVVAFDKRTGEVKYKAINDLASYSSPIITRINGKDVAVVWMRKSLYGFDPNTGNVLWEFPWRARKLESVNASCPVVLDNHLFISECYGLGSALLKLTDKDFEVIWKDKPGRNKALLAHFNTPVVNGDYLFACSGQHPNGAELRCINWKDGSVAWSKPGFARCSCLKVDDHLIVLGEYGRLSLVKMNTTEFEQVSEFDPSTCKFVDGKKCDLGSLRSPCWAAPILSHGFMLIRDKDRVICFDLIPDA